MRIVTRSLRPTSADIQLDEPRRSGATLSLARRAMEAGYLHHSALTCPESGNPQHLKSRHLFVPAVQQLNCTTHNCNANAGLWADNRLNVEWLENTTRLRAFIPDIGTYPSANGPARNRVGST